MHPSIPKPRSRPLRLGTRGSPLALWQARWAAQALDASGENGPVEVVVVRTQAEKFPDRELPEIGIGVFTRELDDALLRGDIDLAVHSLKDVPSELSPGLALVAVPERESPFDTFVSADGTPLAMLPTGARIGTGSPRRKALLLAYRDDLEVVPLRGNVGTRLRKIEAEGLAGTILAHAGLKRMGQEARITEILQAEILVPAVAQGALGIVARSDDDTTRARLAVLDHSPSHLRVLAERGFLRRLRGGCQVPAGALATLDPEKPEPTQEKNAQLRLQAVLAAPDGTTCVREVQIGGATAGEELGLRTAELLLDNGGREILHQLREAGDIGEH